MTQNVEVSTGSLEGLPGDMRFRPVDGKNPGAKGKLWCGDRWRDDDGTDWNSELWKWQTAEQIGLTMAEPSNNYTGVGLMTGRQVGGYCWLDFDGEEVDQATGEIKKSATTDFFAIWHHPVSDLPSAPRNISGREGRFRLLFRVPVAWQQYLRGVSLASVGPTKAVEFLYEKGGGKCFHAVIDGKHPGGNGWFYRWVEGMSPRDIPVPDLPAWVIAGILKHEHKKKLKAEGWSDKPHETEGAQVSSESPLDYLNPGQLKKLLTEPKKGMVHFLPYRGGEAGTPFSGEHDRMRRLILSLWRGIGDERLFETWLQDWDDRNDWSGADGSAPVTGGNMMDFVRSLLKSDAGSEAVAPWKTAWVFAKECGWKPPKGVKEPVAITSASLSGATEKMRKNLQNGLDAIDKMDNPSDRTIAFNELRETVGIKNDKTYRAILLMLQEEAAGGSVKGGKLREVLKNAKPISEAIERFLPFGAVTMLAADPGTGKTAFIYRVAEAAAYGKKFMGQLQCVQGNVLIVQKDESDSNMLQKAELMGLDDPEDLIHVEFQFSAGHLKDLETWIKEHQARYVVMDSFASLFAGGADLTESEAGTYLYLLNAIASKYNVAILLTHHLKKIEGERKNVYLSDFYGSTFIAAGASDAWGLFKDPETEGEDKPFALKNVKPRSGIAQMGDKFIIHGNSEDLSLTMGAVNGLSDGMEVLKKNELKLLNYLKKSTCVEDAIQIGNIGKTGTICGETGLTKKQAQRAMERIKKLPAVKRVKLVAEGQGGGVPFGYWWKAS